MTDVYVDGTVFSWHYSSAGATWFEVFRFNLTNLIRWSCVGRNLYNNWLIFGKSGEVETATTWLFMEKCTKPGGQAKKNVLIP